LAVLATSANFWLTLASTSAAGTAIVRRRSKPEVVSTETCMLILGIYIEVIVVFNQDEWLYLLDYLLAYIIIVGLL
jgi:hypothetical protein